MGSHRARIPTGITARAWTCALTQDAEADRARPRAKMGDLTDLDVAAFGPRELGERVVLHL